jgi:type IV secretion system protein VirD4
MSRIILLLLPFLISIATYFIWLVVWGFDAVRTDHWAWVVTYFRDYQGLPPFLLWSIYGAGGGLLAAIILVLVVSSRVKAKTIHGEHGQNTLHGSAKWADWKDVKRAGLTGRNGVVVGGFAKDSETRTLRHDGPEHILCFAPTRSGKGVSLVLPTLFEWLHSVIVLDIKGENYAKTAGYRKSLSHTVLRFEPAAPLGSVRFNPLAEIRMGTGFEISDAQNIAIMIIDPDGKGLRDFFQKTGYGWLTAGILHVLYRVMAEEKRVASLRDVALFLSAPTKPTSTEAPDTTAPKVEEDGLEKMLKAMKAFDHRVNGASREPVNILVHTAAQEMLNRAGPERSGVHSTAIVELELYRDPIVSANIACSDFRLRDLMNGAHPTALYLIVPPSDIDRLRPLLRIVMNLLLRRLTAEMSHTGDKLYKHRLLLLLDEFTAIGKLEIFERALAFMAGYGLKAFVIVQDTTQLQQEYGRENSIMGNCHIRIAYAPNTPETAKALSEMLGKTTVVQEKRSTSRKGLEIFGSKSDSLSEIARPLLTPDECGKLPGIVVENGNAIAPGDMLIFVAGSNPIYGRQQLYFQNPEFLRRSKIPVPVVSPGT